MVWVCGCVGVGIGVRGYVGMWWWRRGQEGRGGGGGGCVCVGGVWGGGGGGEGEGGCRGQPDFWGFLADPEFGFGNLIPSFDAKEKQKKKKKKHYSNYKL